MALIHRRQQADILWRVFFGKTGQGALTTLERAGLAVLLYQPGDLLTEIAADLH